MICFLINTTAVFPHFVSFIPHQYNFVLQKPLPDSDIYCFCGDTHRDSSLNRFKDVSMLFATQHDIVSY